MTDTLSCSVCKETKPREDFHNRAVCTQRGGKDSQCKVCKAAQRRDYFLRHQGLEQRRSREKAWKNSGVIFTYPEFLERVNEQGGRCKICEKMAGESLHLDHCHDSGTIRGLLCGACNMGLGQFKDNIEVMKKALNYLERHDG